MSTDYGYINARVRGLKSKLLGDEFYNEALQASDFRAFMSALAQSPYMSELEEAQARYDGLKAVDSALARNFYGITRSILNFADGLPGRLIELMLLRYDLANLKTIARARHAGRDGGEVQSAMFPAGQLKPAVLETAATAPDMAAAAQVLSTTKTPLRSAFSRAAARYQSDGDLYALEVALDRAYYKVLFDELRRVDAPQALVRHFRREVDATNLRTALKLRGRGPLDADLFVPGGKEIDRQLVETIAADGSPGSLQPLGDTSFAAVADTTTLSEAESAIRAVLDRSARRLAADPLDIGVVLNFLRRKEEEAARLRLIARGKFYQVPRDQLEKELQGA